MKFKVARWIKAGQFADVVPVRQRQSRRRRRYTHFGGPVDSGYTLEGIQSCARWCGVVRSCSRHCSHSNMEKIIDRFHAEHSKFSSRALFLKKKQGFQLKELRLEVHELGLILRGYARIGGLLDLSKSQTV